MTRSFDDPRFWKVSPGTALGVLELEASFLDVVKVLGEEGIDFEEEGDSTVYLPDLSMTLYFSTGPTKSLRLIECDDHRVRFGTLKVLGDYPHNVLGTLGIPEVETVWCSNLSAITSPETYLNDEKEMSDGKLLSNGTIWITSLGIGMGLSNGAIVTLLLCDPAYSPPSSRLGGFRAEQRELSERLQLNSFKRGAKQSTPRQRFATSFLFISFVATVSFFGFKSWELEQKWNEAKEADAIVIAVSPPPPDPFPTEYTVEYSDLNDHRHQMVLRANDIYATSKIGETIKIRYLSDSPKTALGPAKVQDIGFNHFVPYLLWCLGIFMSLHVVSDFLLSRRILNARTK